MRYLLLILFVLQSVLLSSQQLSIDMTCSEGVVSHAGSGFLFGFSGNEPSFSLFENLAPQLLRYRAVIDGPAKGWFWDSNLKQIGHTGIYSDLMMQRLQNMDVRQQIVVSDSYSERGYSFPLDINYIGWPGDSALNGISPNDKLLEIVDKQVNHIISKGYKNIEWDLWNEPDASEFWPSDRFPNQYYATWQLIYKRIRLLCPTAIIVGPSYAYFKSQNSAEDGTSIKDFLRFAKENGCLPDRITWHELSADAHTKIVKHVNIIRDFMRNELKINPLPIDLNEIIGPDNIYKPGVHVWNFAEIEKAGVEGACHAVWNEIESEYTSNGLLAGHLCHLLTQTSPVFEPRSVWHTYYQYSLLEGKRLHLTPTQNINGIAAYNETKKELTILLGNDKNISIETSLVLNKVKLNSNVSVSVTHIPDNGRGSLLEIGDPTIITFASSNGELSFPLLFKPNEAIVIKVKNIEPDVEYLYRYQSNNLLPATSGMEYSFGPDFVFSMAPSCNASARLETTDYVEGHSCGKIEVIKNSTEKTDISLSTSNFKLGRNREYILSFLAKSDDDCSLTIRIQNGKNTWINGERTISLTPDWNTYEFTLKSPPTTSSSTISMLSFYFGENKGTYYIDNITLTEKKYETYPKVLPPLSDNLSSQLLNGKFEQSSLYSWFLCDGLSLDLLPGLPFQSTYTLKSDIDNAGVNYTNPFSKSLSQGQIFLNSDKIYKISYMAYGKTPMYLFTSIENETFTSTQMDFIAKEWRRFEHNIHVPENSLYNLKIGFAYQTGTCFVDNIILTNGGEEMDVTSLYSPFSAEIMSAFEKDGFLYIQSSQEQIISLCVFDILGRIIYRSISPFPVGVSPLPVILESGVYYIRLENSSKQLITNKIKVS